MKRLSGFIAIFSLIFAYVVSPVAIQAVGSTELLTGDSMGVGNSFWSDISGDGRLVVFSSNSSTLVANDTNNVNDIFLRDRQINTTTRVSVDSNGTQGNGHSFNAAISQDGNFVVFRSQSNNLVAGDTNGEDDVFRYNVQSGVVDLVSATPSGAIANDSSVLPAISQDGRYVAFISRATNLVANDTNNRDDGFVKDMLLGTVERVSVSTSGMEGNDSTGDIEISSDGNVVAFASDATNLTPGDSNNNKDIFVRDLSLGTTDSITSVGNHTSRLADISDDGQFIGFMSFASNLIASDNNDAPDIFVHDRSISTTERVSIADDGSEGNGAAGSQGASLSSDGRFITFSSSSSNLVMNDNNSTTDVFVRDRHENTTERISIGNNSTEGNDASYLPAISGDGSVVSYTSFATNFIVSDPYSNADIYAVELEQTPMCNGLEPTIIGTDGDDNIVGTNGVDVIVGLGGDDTISGKQGDDVICGGDGDDDIQGRYGDDIIFGGDGNDVIRGNQNEDTIYGGDGDDDIQGGTGADTIYAGAGLDIVLGNQNTDIIYGEGGDDILEGGYGDDQIFGGDDNDTLEGNQGADLLDGEAGTNTGNGGTGMDTCLNGTFSNCEL